MRPTRPALLALVLGAALTSAPVPTTAGHPIIDMHLHAGRGVAGQSWSDVIDGMDRHSVVLATLSVEDPNIAVQHPASERFWTGPSFPCHEGRYPIGGPCFAESEGWPDLDWLRAEYGAGRMRIMGELFYVYLGIPPTDERLAPYWALAEELDIPVGVHTGRGPYRRAPDCCPRFDDDLGNPALLEPVLERHPKLRVWLMHSPGWDYLDEAIALMKAHPNVYAEMSILNSVMPAGQHEAHVRSVADAGLLDRIMLGTDNVPLAPIIARIEALDFLTPQQRSGIYCDNAARFLRLDPQTCARREP